MEVALGARGLNSPRGDRGPVSLVLAGRLGLGGSLAWNGHSWLALHKPDLSQPDPIPPRLCGRYAGTVELTRFLKGVAMTSGGDVWHQAVHGRDAQALDPGRLLSRTAVCFRRKRTDVRHRVEEPRQRTRAGFCWKRCEHRGGDSGSPSEANAVSAGNGRMFDIGGVEATMPSSRRARADRLGANEAEPESQERTRAPPGPAPPVSFRRRRTDVRGNGGLGTVPADLRQANPRRAASGSEVELTSLVSGVVRAGQAWRAKGSRSARGESPQL